MKLIFLGTGSAFTLSIDNYNSNMLLLDEYSDNKLLIDCGSDARHSLGRLGYSYRDITDVYISHIHADHMGGLEWLALTRKFDPLCSKPNLYANTKILTKLWKHSLSGGLSTIPGKDVDLEYFFNVCKIGRNNSFDWNNIKFQLVQTIHIISGGELMPSYGLMFKINNTCIFITTDTQFTPNQLVHCYKQADIIFHDCETDLPRSGVHSNYLELTTLDPAFKAKMWLYHYNSEFLPDPKKDGFCGFVHRGQVFEFDGNTP